MNHMARKNTLRAAILAALALPLAAQAQDVSVEELLKRLEAQEQKIQALEQKLEARDEAAAGQAPSADAEAQQQILVLERKLELQQEAADAAKASAPVATVISSRNDSFANVFCMRPGERIHDGRKGVVASR